MTVTVRPATPDDAAAIAGIHAASWRSAYRGLLPDEFLDTITPDQRRPMWEGFLAAADAGSPRVWVASVHEQVLGFCSIGPASDATDDGESVFVLHTIYLQPDAARRGIGTALIARAEEAMRKQGVARAELWVLRDNQTARRFYEANGWELDPGSEKEDQVWGQTVVEVRYRKDLRPTSGQPS